MAKSMKRSREQLARDRAELFALFLKGYTYRAIQVTFNKAETERGYALSKTQVFDDIKAALKEFKVSNAQMVDDQMHIELARINKLEREYWDAWERSCSMRRKIKIEGGAIDGGQTSGGSLKERTSEELFGDPRYLQGVQWCVDRRCKLMGLDQPIEITGTLGLYEFMKSLEKDVTT